jgi:hypothetical protein
MLSRYTSVESTLSGIWKFEGEDAAAELPIIWVRVLT